MLINDDLEKYDNINKQELWNKQNKGINRNCVLLTLYFLTPNYDLSQKEQNMTKKLLIN